MKLIAGLGNPGNEYKDTRHNIGYLAVDRLSLESGITLQKKRFNSFFGVGTYCGGKVIIAKPLTFMNLSGEAVSSIAGYYKIAAEDIIIIHDDMDIDFGMIRVKKQGGSAGHRGIESVIKSLQKNSFIRIRIGIGKPQSPIPPSDYVLQKFSDKEQNELKGVIHNIQKCIAIILKQGPEKAMNMFHSGNQMVQQID